MADLSLLPVWGLASQVAMATGQVLFHRFFYSKSFVKHSFEVSSRGGIREREAGGLGGGGGVLECFCAF